MEPGFESRLCGSRACGINLILSPVDPVDRKDTVIESKGLAQYHAANKSWSQDSNPAYRLLNYTRNHSSELPFSSQPAIAVSSHLRPHPHLHRDETLWDLLMEASARQSTLWV